MCNMQFQSLYHLNLIVEGVQGVEGDWKRSGYQFSLHFWTVGGNLPNQPMFDLQLNWHDYANEIVEMYDQNRGSESNHQL